MADELKVDFGDGVSALDRVMRAIVFMMDGAIAELTRLGYERNFDHITVAIPDEGFPSWIEMRGERMFEVNATITGAIISIQGTWLRKPKRRRWFSKFLFWTRAGRAGAA